MTIRRCAACGFLRRQMPKTSDICSVCRRSIMGRAAFKRAATKDFNLAFDKPQKPKITPDYSPYNVEVVD